MCRSKKERGSSNECNCNAKTQTGSSSKTALLSVLACAGGAGSRSWQLQRRPQNPAPCSGHQQQRPRRCCRRSARPTGRRRARRPAACRPPARPAAAAADGAGGGVEAGEGEHTVCPKPHVHPTTRGCALPSTMSLPRQHLFSRTTVAQRSPSGIAGSSGSSRSSSMAPSQAKPTCSPPLSCTAAAASFPACAQRSWASRRRARAAPSSRPLCLQHRAAKEYQCMLGPSAINARSWRHWLPTCHTKIGRPAAHASPEHL